MRLSKTVLVVAALYLSVSILFFVFSIVFGVGRFWEVRAFEVLKWFSDLVFAIFVASYLKGSMDREGRERETALLVVDRLYESILDFESVIHEYFTEPTNETHRALVGGMKGIAKQAALLPKLAATTRYSIPKAMIERLNAAVMKLKRGATGPTIAEILANESGSLHVVAISAHSEMVLGALEARVQVCQ